VYLALFTDGSHIAILGSAGAGEVTRTHWVLATERIVHEVLHHGSFAAIQVSPPARWATTFHATTTGLLRVLGERAPDVPLGFSLDAEIQSDLTIASEVDQERVGITCAIFVLTVFKRLGLPLVNLDEWEVGEETIAYYELIRVILSKVDRTQHVDYLLGQIPNVRRVSPVNVAAAALHGGFPSSRRDIETAAVRIREAYDLETDAT